MLAHADKIELIAQKDDEYSLVLVAEAGEWDAVDTAIQQLQDKVINTVSFALDGQMADALPDSVGKRVSIVVKSVDPIPDEVRTFAEELGRRTLRYGLPLTVAPLPPLPPEEQAA